MLPIERRARRRVVPVAVAPEHSKRQVKLAGKLLREVRVAFDADDHDALDAFDPAAVYDAMAMVEWWRSLP
jgi:hypothetical protein